MTRQFEVIQRDGAARLGRLRWADRELSTPCVLESKDELELLEEMTEGNAELDVEVIKDPEDVHGTNINADIIILAGALRFEDDPRGLSRALIKIKESTNPDTALYAPTLATPQNISMLIYAGVDIVDSVFINVKAREGYLLYTDGEERFDEIPHPLCLCDVCRNIDFGDGSFEQKTAIASEHNRGALLAELHRVRAHVRKGTLRELAEARCRTTPTLTAFLRLLDEEYSYFERRSPIVRTATLLACSQESLDRAEIRRFNERVIERLHKREGILLLLPCSARKPYSRSRSHRIVLARLYKLRPFLNEAIITSPIGVVPRSLEVTYPASNYDIPVTGRWTCDERERVVEQLARYIEINAFDSIIAHVDGPYKAICDDVAVTLGVDMIHPSDSENILSSHSLQCLEEIVRDLIEKHSPVRRDLRFDYLRDLADYQFGKDASAALFSRVPKIRGVFPRYYASDRGRRIVTLVDRYGTLALTIEGAKRYIDRHIGHYCVWIDDFEPKGTIFAVGVLRADSIIRPFDEVIVLSDNTIAVGRALMSGWEMEASNRGAAVAVRHVEAR